MTERPTERQLAEWKALEAAASPGPWLAFDQSKEPDRIGDNWDITDDPDWTVTTDGVPVSHMTGAWDDYPFIAAARTAMPILLAEVARLQQERNEATAAVQEELWKAADREEAYARRIVDALDRDVNDEDFQRLVSLARAAVRLATAAEMGFVTIQAEDEDGPGSLALSNFDDMVDLLTAERRAELEWG